MGKPKLLLRESHDMRRQHDAAGVSGPMRHIEARIVLRKVGIAAVAENALHEIEIADQAARCDEPDFHGLRRIAAGGRTNQRPQQQRDEAVRACLFGLPCRAGSSDPAEDAAPRSTVPRRPASAPRPCRPEPETRPRQCETVPAWCAGRCADCAARPAAGDTNPGTATRRNPQSPAARGRGAMPSRSSTKVFAGSRAAPCGHTSLR